MKKLNLLKTVLFCAMGFWSMPSHALLSTCSLKNVIAPSLQVYNPGNASPVVANFNFTVGCRLLSIVPLGVLTTYTVGLSAGSSGSTTNRAMQGPMGSTLSYSITNNANGNIVGLGGASGELLGGTLTILGLTDQNTDYSLRLTVPPRQLVRPGAYSDSVVLELNFF